MVLGRSGFLGGLRGRGHSRAESCSLNIDLRVDLDIDREAFGIFAHDGLGGIGADVSVDGSALALPVEKLAECGDGLWLKGSPSVGSGSCHLGLEHRVRHQAADVGSAHPEDCSHLVGTERLSGRNVGMIRVRLVNAVTR